MVVVPLLDNFISGFRSSAFWLVIVMVLYCFLFSPYYPCQQSLIHEPLQSHMALLLAISLLIALWAFSSMWRYSDEQQKRALDDFVSRVTHEFRTPLFAMLHCTKTLSESSLPPESQEEVATLEVCVNLMISNVSNLLYRGEPSLQLTNGSFSFVDLLTPIELIGQHLTHGTESSFTVEADTSELPLHVYGSLDSLAHVLTNLVGNAFRHASRPDGRVRVVLRVSPIKGSNNVLFEVEDNGAVPIPEENLKRLFDAYFSTGGTGLGLSIARNLVCRMKGSLWVENRALNDVFAGVRFSFVVPLPPSGIVAGSVGSLAVSTASQGPGLDPGTIVWVVDDGPLNRKVLKSMLERLKLERITLFSDGSEVLEALSVSSHPSVILMDRMMKTDGFVTTKAVREFERAHDLVPSWIVCTTADDSCTEELVKGFEMDAVLLKPFHAMQLQIVLSNRDSRQSRMNVADAGETNESTE